MATQDIERLHYYQRQFLGAVDFDAEQSYQRDMRRRHNLGHHIWGIVTGLELVEKQEGSELSVYVLPGMAVDGFGREVVLLAPYKLDPADFEAFNTAGHREVWIAYREDLVVPPGRGYEGCDTDGQFNRVLETFHIVPQPGAATHDPVTVDGHAVDVAPTGAAAPDPTQLIIPDDESAPYQEFPDEDLRPMWLVRLGTVNWDGTVQHFVPAAAGRLDEGRRFVSVVAQSVLAPDGELRLRARTAPPDPDAADFASVEGRLRVDGRIVAEKDVLLYGGRLSLDETGGGDSNVPLWLQRTQPGAGGTDLTVHIGDTGAADTRLAVGFGTAPSETVVLAVRGDDVVQVASGTLDFGSTARQMMNLWSTADGKEHRHGVGVQTGTTYFRSSTEFRWYRGGEHNDDPNDASQTDHLQLLLDDQARLHLGASTRQMLNLWHTNYGIGVQAWTLYARSDADFCWFRNGSHSDTRGDAGGGGTLAMRLDDTSTLRVTGGLTVNGTTTLSGDLQVNGKLRVQGSQNLQIRTETFAKKNAGTDAAGSWDMNYAGSFAEKPQVFVVLQGYSLWGNDGDTSFSSKGHVADVNAIPQHAVVRVLDNDSTHAWGTCYLSESDGTLETDNTLLFTVVAIGRSA